MVEVWPPQSLDINPIEQVWELLETKLEVWASKA